MVWHASRLNAKLDELAERRARGERIEPPPPSDPDSGQMLYGAMFAAAGIGMVIGGAPLIVGGALGLLSGHSFWKGWNRV